MQLVDRDGAARVLVVRTDDAAFVPALRARFGRWVVEDHPDVGAVVSIRMGARRGSVQDLHVVHRRGFEATRVRTWDEALDAAAGLLPTFRSRPPGTIEVHARVLEHDGAAVLVGDGFREVLDGHRRRLRSAGWRVGTQVPVLVDPATAEAVLPASDDPGDLRLRRVPVSHAVVFAPLEDPAVSPARRLLDVAMLVAGRDEPIRAVDLAGLAALTEQVAVVRLDTVRPGDVTPVLVALC